MIVLISNKINLVGALPRFFEGVFLNNDKFPELNKKIDKLAEAKDVPNTTIEIAWILRHLAKIQPIVGTTNIARLRTFVRRQILR